MTSPTEGLTQLLKASAAGDTRAFDRAFPVVYDALRAVAHRRLAQERRDHTLSTTELVHETYLKLVDLKRIEYAGRAHFFAVAAQAMRNILVTHARRRAAAKRGGGQVDASLDDVVIVSEERSDDLISLDDALQRLERLNERQHRVVEGRFFAGMTNEEMAEVLGVSPATVKRDWSFARAWLNRELEKDGDGA